MVEFEGTGIDAGLPYTIVFPPSSSALYWKLSVIR